MWSIFSQSLNEDESINNEFCTSGIFKIACEDLVSKYPNVQALVQSKRMVVAIDKSVILLEDENVAKCSSLCFSTAIDCIAISKTGNLIICCLADGNLHGIYITGVPVFNLAILQDDIQEMKTFCGIEQFGKEFHIICTNGSIYRLSNVDEPRPDLVAPLKENETIAIDETIMDSVTIDRIRTTNKLNEITAFVIIAKEDTEETYDKTINEHIFISGTKRLLHFNEDDNDIKVLIPDNFCGLKAIYNLDNYLIGLTNDGHLLEICPHTKLIFHSFSSLKYLIDDMVIMENNDEIIEFLLLTKADSDGKRIMKIAEFPSFECSYELEMPKNTWLVQQPKSSVNLYYLSAENENAQEHPQEIEMKLVSETQPADRLKKLIHKGHLEEAEEFGKQFELSLQPIFEAKARKILLEIRNSVENDIELIELKYQGLVTVLRQIENKQFLANIRSMEIPSRKLLFTFLDQMLILLNDEKFERDMYEIKEQQLRLETLNIIDPYECNLDWQKFVYHPHIVKICTSMFKTDMLVASFIWKRHCSSIIPQLDQSDALKLLQLIPSSTEAFEIVQWLRHFIPTVIQSYPKIMPSIIEWSIQKTRSLQFSIHWPEVGLEFSTKVFNIFNDISFIHSDVSRQHESSIEKLRNLVNALQDLSVLKKTYNLVFTLNSYITDSLDETAFCILQRVQLINLKSLVSNFLYPIYMKKGQSPNIAIINYIDFLVAQRYGLSSWLERATYCIQLLHNEEEKLKCSLKVLQSAPVPWSDIVAPLIKLRNSTHPIAIQIATEYEIQIIKILKVKYGYPADSTDSNMKLIFRIVKVDLPEMIDDIKDLTKATPEIESSANFYCCYELARTGKIENALHFFNSLQEKQKTECSEQIINIFSNVAAIDDLSHGNLFEFFKLIIPHSSKSDREHLIAIRNSQILKRKFNLEMQNGVKSHKSIREEILKKGIESIVTTVTDKKKNIVSYVWQEVSELCQVLNLDQLNGMLEISKIMNNLQMSCALGNYALELIDPSEMNAELFINFAVTIIVQQLIACRTGELDSFDPMPYPIAYKLLVKAAKICKIHQTEIIELLKWIRIVNSNYSLTAVKTFYENSNDVNKMVIKMMKKDEHKDAKMNGQGHAENKKRPSISIFDEIIPKVDNLKENMHIEVLPIVKCVSLTLLVVLFELKAISPAFQRLKCHLDECAYDLQEQLTEDFFKTLEHQLKSKQYTNWYTISQYLLSYQKNSEYVIIHQTYVSMQLKKIFRQSLMQKEPNFIDLFAMLVSDVNPKLHLHNLNSDIKNDLQKIHLMILSEMYYTHTEDLVKVKTIRESRMKQFYYSELCKHDCSLKTKTDIELVSIAQLMKELRNKLLNVSLLEKLSRDFDWDYQTILITQVITVLRLQEPNFEIKTDTFGKEELVMKTTVDEIKKLCQPYINEIKNTELLSTKLLKFVTEINYYFYELYLCVVDILTYVNALPTEMELWTNILVFLKHKLITKRRPGQMEIDWWLKSQTEVGVPPKIAKYRLPFIPIVQKPLKDILDVEVNVDNCESWFPLISLHTILQGTPSIEEIVKMQDYFCMSAVKNSISEYKQQNESDQWNLEPVNNAFLQSILRLVKHVSCESKILLILYFVASHAPDGADQVEASHECFKYAIKHEATLSEKSLESVAKIKRKYPILKTQHLLHIYGLIEDRLLQIVENPKDLIHELYHHEMILRPMKTKPDINKICEEISALHNLDFNLLQISLLQKWLSFTTAADAPDFEETFYEDVNNSNSINQEDINSDSVIRAQYILRSWESDKAMQFLVCHIFEGSANTSKQLQMYECFSQLLDEKNASYTDVVNQRQYITIKCVHDLKQLGYNFTIEKFAEYDKISILKKIWQNHSNNHFAMEVIANICLGFNIYITKIWNGVLKQMVKFNMVKELNALVEKLSCKPELLHTEGLAKAWESILKLPFKKANRTRSTEQEEFLSRTMFSIQSCPLVSKLNLVEIAEDCIRLERPHMASVLIVFSSIKEQKECIKTMLKPHFSDQFKKDIRDLEEYGILRSIINLVFKELEL